MKKTIVICLFSLGMIGLSGAALAQGGERKGGRRGPPPEAIDACKDKASGDACTFESPRHGTVQGTCWAPKADLPLACRPANRPGRDR